MPSEYKGMKRTVSILLLAICGCATPHSTPQKNVLLWKDIETVLKDPFVVDRVLIDRYALWARQKTHVIEKASPKRVLWEYHQIRWSTCAPGISISTTQYVQHKTDRERRRWLSHLSISVEPFIKYLRSTNQEVPPFLLETPKEIREKYTRPETDSVDDSGSGEFFWRREEYPAYELDACVKRVFRNGKLILINYGF